MTAFTYLTNGIVHRSGGLPATEYFDKESGALLSRSWWEGGEYVRSDGLPHIESFDPQTSKLVRAEYRIRVDGMRRNYTLHRSDGPALLIFDRNTGEQIAAEFYIKGRRQDPEKFRSLRSEFKL